jgi:DNA-binding transcriptional LysR family regulator
MSHLHAFLQRYPEIRVDATLTDATVDLIESGADLAVRIGALADSSLIARRLADHRRVLVATQTYLDAAAPLSTPADLTQHACLMFALQPTPCWYFQTGEVTEPIAVKVDGRMRANDSEAIRTAALHDLGIALLPSWLVWEEIRDKRLVPLLTEWNALIAPGPERAIWAVYPPKKIVAPKVRVFLDFLQSTFGSPAYWDRAITENM